MAVQRKPAAAPAPQAEPARPQAREDMRPIIPGRAVALNRQGLPTQRAGAEAGVNQFAIPSNLPPQGWAWQWKRESCYGQTDEFYTSQLLQHGWEHVMYESYPGVFAPQYDEKGGLRKGPVRRLGLMLMERPMALELEAQADEKRKADERVGNSKHQYVRSLNTQGTYSAEFDPVARAMSGVKQNVEFDNTAPRQGPID